MGRIFTILVIVLAIWVGAEVYTHGVGGAFGGVLAATFEAPANRSTSDRAADAFQRAYRQSEDRVDRLLDEDTRP